MEPAVTSCGQIHAWAYQPRSYLKKKKQKNQVETRAQRQISGLDNRTISSSSLQTEQNPCRSSLNRTLDKCMELQQYHKSKRRLHFDEHDDPLSSDGPDSPDELQRTSRSFLKKSQSASQPIEEVEEEDHIEEMQKSIDPTITSIEKDSLEIDDSVVASGPTQALHGIGLDTLEEQEEKERFFARLEKGASSTIDYSKLIKDLDSTDSTQLTAYNRDRVEADEDEHKDESKDVSVNYSEDFEDEAEASSQLLRKSEENDGLEASKTQAHHEEGKLGMLAKVLLIDSMDSTIDTQKILQQTDETDSILPQETNEAMGTGISNQYTNNSEMEALHQAYQNLDTEEHISYLKTTHSTETPEEHAVPSKDKSLSKVLVGDSEDNSVNKVLLGDSEDNGVNKVLAADSDVSTVEELMQRLRGGDFTSSSVNMRTDKGSLPYTLHDPIGKEKLIHEDEVSHALHDWNGENTRSRHADRPENYPAINQAASGLIHHKHPQKKVKSPLSSSKKSQNAHYANVKSSGYGKVIISLKRTSNDDDLKIKELHNEVMWKSPTNQKGVSSTKSIRFADSTTHYPKGKLEHQENAAHQREKMSVSLSPSGKAPQVTWSNVGDNDMTILQRLHNVEEKLNAGQGQKAQENSLRMEQEFHQELEKIKRNYEKEIEELKQENFILQTKLHAGEEKIKKRNLLFGDQSIPVTEDKIQQIKQEILEQETLLKGYHQENERLYNQVKELQQKNRQNEEQMFRENQALKAELRSVREKVNAPKLQNQYANGESGHDPKSCKEVDVEQSAIQKKEISLLEEIARYKKEKQALEVDLLQMKKERDLLKGQLANISDDTSYQIKILEETSKKEIARLNKRLQWFAENQDLLDKDAGRLKDAYEQIESLKMQVTKLRHDTGNQYVQQQNRLKDRAADAKRIQDLERQVKEMEAIIKRRHPNSIPALMFAAAATSEIDKPSKSNTISYLEKRIQKLENDLESKDEEAKKSLRSMEQNFQKVKIQYESRINELEDLLAHRPLNEPHKIMDNTVKVKALEQELSIFKDAHHTTVMNLQKENEALKSKTLILEHKLMLKEGNVEELTEQARMTRLNRELVSKSKEIQELSKTVERLQKERMTMLSVKPHSNPGMTASVLPPFSGSQIEEEHFPAEFDGKSYKPYLVTDFHISEVKQQNKRLEAKVLQISQDMSQQITHYKMSLDNSESALKRLKEEAAEQVAALKQLHQREIEKLICQQALEHSSSRVAELSSKISTQEILIKHLQKQVGELQKDKETLSVSQIREKTLQKEMTKLLDELRMAKECHSPEMKHFLTLESKIKHMEMRNSQREQELQQIIDQTLHVAEATQIKETEKWKRLVQQKNMELEKFRTELDAILDVLRILQKQGVVIPSSASEAYQI
ncbi:centrosomal protein of 162 kDa isoform X3 [Engystomops pustulosus]|uniref:centrosomal protein of 162 kDa isoform X3 n=1 Tax=Engystomops pustulosus TaxID=76066 RepID=UPI003AFAAB3A